MPDRVPPKRSSQIESGFGINSDLPRDPYLPWDRWWWTRMFDTSPSGIRPDTITPEPGSFHNDDRSLYSIFWPPTTPDQIEAFVKYVRFVVNHFRGRIQLYALWNEQDITYWNPIANPEEYGRLLKAFVPAVHETDRQAKVIYGGLADPSSDFARRSLDACKCAAGIDVFAYHTYPGYGQNLNPESMDYGAYGPDAPVKLRETVRHYPGIRKDIPFWDDEFNSIPSWAGSDESVQAKYVSRGRIRGSMHPSRLCHLTFRRCVANPSFPSSRMGFGPKPASRLWRIGWERTVCPATFSRPSTLTW